MTLIIIVVTFIFSYLAFQKSELMYKYQFNAYQIVHRNEWQRLITHAFLHANWPHLLVNMLVLFSFGSALERYFGDFFGSKALFYYALLYFGSIPISSLYSLIQNKDNHYYNAVGASGATSAVIFACIFFAPMQKLYFFGIIPIPGILFGIGYLIYSYRMSKQNNDNIGHDAHFWGAVYGFIFPLLINPKLIFQFINQINFWS